MGDFAATANTFESLPLSAQGVKLGLPLSTLALEASALPDFSDQTYIGYGARSDERLDVVLWPSGSVCDLSSGGSYPDRLGGQALGYGPRSGLVMIAGSDQAESSSVVGALTFDTRTGESEVVDPRVRSVLSVARSFATISDFGSKLLVAGGENSLFESAPLDDSAEVYDPAERNFEPDLIKLAVPRAHHAALSLVSGEVALFGGRGPDTLATSFVEVVSPDTRVSKLVDNLWLARNAPVVLRLSDGRLFVAGGSDRAGHPVAGLEWRDADATRRLDAPFDGSTELPPRFDRAFAALPGGAVLAVGGCEDRAPAAGEDCQATCAHGCPPEPDQATGNRYDAYWIAADGAVFALDFPLSAAQPVLLPGSDGRPWLVAEEATHRQLYRFDPWQRRFVRTSVDLDLDRAQSAPAFLATGSDAFVWLDQRAAGPTLHGIRLGTRSTFSNDTALIQQRDPTDATLPAHLVPDRPASGRVGFDSADASLAFSANAAGDTPICVWLTDAEFANFSADIAFTTNTAPNLRLGSQWLGDEAAAASTGGCALPPVGDTPGGTLSLTRSGTQLSMALGSARGDCVVTDARVGIALCGSALGDARVTRLRITRRD